MKQVILCVTALVLALCLLASCGAEVVPASSESSAEATSAPESSAEEVSAPVSEAESDMSVQSVSGVLRLAATAKMEDGLFRYEVPDPMTIGLPTGGPMLGGVFAGDPDGVLYYVDCEQIVDLTNKRQIASFDDVCRTQLADALCVAEQIFVLSADGIVVICDPKTGRSEEKRVFAQSEGIGMYLTVRSDKAEPAILMLSETKGKEIMIGLDGKELAESPIAEKANAYDVDVLQEKGGTVRTFTTVETTICLRDPEQTFRIVQTGDLRSRREEGGDGDSVLSYSLSLEVCGTLFEDIRGWRSFVTEGGTVCTAIAFEDRVDFYTLNKAAE